MSFKNKINEALINTPIEVNIKYSSSDGVPLLDSILYHTIVWSLVYLTITQSNIAYVVHVVSQFLSSPTTVDWAFVYRIFCIFEVQPSRVFYIHHSSLELHAYLDADYGSDFTNCKSIIGFFIFLGDSVISWKSKKQSIFLHLQLQQSIVL